MALAADEATFNEAVETFIAAWVTFVNTLDAGEEVQIVFMSPKKGDNANNTSYGAPGSATAVYDFGRRFFVKNTPDVTGDVPLGVGNQPFFWKVTNLAGDLAGA